MSKAAKRERQRTNREARRQIEEAEEKRRKRLRTARNFALVLAPIIIIFVILQLRDSGDSSDKKSDTPSKDTPQRTFSDPPPMTIDPAKQYAATLDTSEGEIVFALDAANAPTGVNNYVFLAKKHFYDGLDFSRVAKDFVIQAGSPKSDGIGGPGYSIVDEVPPNGYQVGSVAYAKGGNEPAGTAGSQFFIVTSPAPNPGEGLDFLNEQPYQYGGLGTVTSGLDVAQKIGTYAPSSGDGEPTTKVKIDKVTITESGGDTSTTATTAATPPSS